MTKRVSDDRSRPPRGRGNDVPDHPRHWDWDPPPPVYIRVELTPGRVLWLAQRGEVPHEAVVEAHIDGNPDLLVVRTGDGTRLALRHFPEAQWVTRGTAGARVPTSLLSDVAVVDEDGTVGDFTFMVKVWIEDPPTDGRVIEHF